MTRLSALIIDDEPDIRELLEITLIRMGLDTTSASNVAEAKQYLKEQDFALCLTDMNLPDGNGIDLVAYMQEHYSDMPVAMITAYGNVETAISALKAGAFDFISKPVDLSQLRDIVTSALKLSEGKNTPPSPEEHASRNILIGHTKAVEDLQAKIRKLARSQAPIYISGESGCGKELVARLIHYEGPRAAAPFVPVNCGAIPAELMESEFFGHMKGSFSGAMADKQGLFQAAQGGTLFLDEVADLPLSMQVKLLRAIQEKSVRPVGSQSESKIDVRILSATHKDLALLVEQGQFRQDLFYRINVIRLDVPSLRERAEDIPLLSQYFLEKVARNAGYEDAFISRAAQEALNNYAFPGNVRELENIIERAFTLCEGNTIEREDLKLNQAQAAPRQKHQAPAIEAQEPATSGVTETPDQPDPSAQKARPLHADANHISQNSQNADSTVLAARRPEQSLEDYLESIERREIEAALNDTKWNRTAAAKKLGISFRALRYRLKKLDMD